MSPKRATKINRLVDAKNAIRGAISNHQSSIIDTIAKQIEDLEPSSAADFVDWLSGYPAQQYDLHPQAKIKNYADLTFRLGGEWRDLDASLLWARSFLKEQHLQIERFLELAGEFEQSWLGAETERAETILQKIENELGLSVWLIQARIAFLQRCRGLEAQKTFARHIHDTAPRTLAASISHYVSHRNETTVSLARFRQRIDRLVANPRVPANKRNYLRVQLSGIPLMELGNSDIAGYLGICLGLSVIDGYEALLDCLQAICLKDDFERHKDSVLGALSVCPKEDYRLEKLRAIVNENFNNVPARSWESEEWYVLGDCHCSAISFLDLYKQTLFDVDALIWCAAAYAQASEPPERTNLGPLPLEYLKWAIAVRARTGDLSANIFDATKSLINLRVLRTARAMLAHVYSEVSDVPAQGVTAATEQFWATQYLHPAHALHLPIRVAELMLDECHRRDKRNVAVRLYRDELLGLNENDVRLDRGVALETRTLARLYHNDVQGALAAATDLARAEQGIFWRRAAQLEVHCLLRVGDTDGAIRRTAFYCCEEDELRFVLPLSELLLDGRWRDIRHLRGEIALAIAIDIAIRTLGDSRYITNRRIAYDEFLIANRCSRPSELASNVLRFPLKQLVYFFQRICVPDIMDVSFQVFKTSHDLENERIKVCALLSQLDPSHSGIYTEEIKEITRLINLQEGLRDVDKSRVHVNTDAIIAWAESELKESFQRYKELAKLASRLSAQTDLETAMREAAAGERHALDEYLHYPNEEGDSLLIEIFETIKREYFLNSDFGLDAYLSMRIRHGSLAGHLRGPLEERRLLITSDKAPPRFLKDAGEVEDFSRYALGSLYQSFSEFSRAYDAIIDDLAKNKLQIRRSEKPHGLFLIDTIPLLIYYARSRIQPQTEFIEFCREVLIAIEVLLSKNLVEIRRYLTQEVKQQVEGVFDKFRESLEAATSSERYSVINSEIASALPEVQAAIDRVAVWFALDQAQQIAALRSVDQILDIAIEATKNARRGFNPRIERHIQDLGQQSQAVLLEFTDILFTILDNVYRHSEMGEEPWVRIEITAEDCPDLLRKRVRVRVDSKIGPNVRTPDAVAKLDRIRGVMASDEYRRLVNLEGGTGLLKLKRLIALDSRQTLDFGFAGDDLFFVDVTLLFIFVTPEQHALMAAQ